ncbi:DUF1385 domain-containing protein [bacterium]|nr:DUF1385 domain-containing protein [bacterium]
MLQRITTREPNEGQVEVALAALKEALHKQKDEYLGPPRDEDLSSAEQNLAKAS